MYKTIITIDPGTGGGISVYHNGKAEVVNMPEGVKAINRCLKSLDERFDNIILFIEKVQSFGAGDNDRGKSFAIGKMLKNYAELITIIQLIGFHYVEVPPITWQTTLKLKEKRPKEIEYSKWKTMRKRAYKEYALLHFPYIKVTLKTSDALCLIKFAIEKMQHDIKWVTDRIQNTED